MTSLITSGKTDRPRRGSRAPPRISTSSHWSVVVGVVPTRISWEKPKSSRQAILESPSRSSRAPSAAESRPRKSPSRIKAKDVMNLVALWSSKSVDRKAEVARRLRAYWRARSTTDPTITNLELLTVPPPSKSSPSTLLVASVVCRSLKVCQAHRILLQSMLIDGLVGK
ncbi:hypothetical protein PtA15_8A314 [Puccinia triticina]|uniref:Uncharacterized protein n=1 Tax=Puccinia triticina TaxID=208348 RepID=A0ABY7CUF0_9BASI|nr:uncharacterized protein PtA15_8A314 [Puccinia triticina]WAQ87410.1 hypothetical protein PtA15_8A314 [Puccinia triticina]WAR57264.1 hypothetical protein PtB15_8B311 [Puccinia triticina]